MIAINKTYLIQMTGTGQEKDKIVKISLDIFPNVKYNMVKLVENVKPFKESI